MSHAVLNVFSERTVFVRLPDKAGGPQRTAWQRAFQGLKQAEEEGYPPYGAPHLWASGAGSDRVAFATLVMRGTRCGSFSLSTRARLIQS